MLSVAFVSRMSPILCSVIESAYSVFNHYNRVRANLSMMQDEEAEQGWDNLPSEDRTFYSPDDVWTEIPTFSSARYAAVAPASIHPHPYRMPLPSMPLRSRHAFPLFEKSNVLVMYVISLSMLFLFVTCNHISLPPQRTNRFR